MKDKFEVALDKLDKKLDLGEVNFAQYYDLQKRILQAQDLYYEKLAQKKLQEGVNEAFIELCEGLSQLPKHQLDEFFGFDSDKKD